MWQTGYIYLFSKLNLTNRMRTSSFFKKGSDPNAVSISRIVPSWYNGRRYEPLAPHINLVNSYINGVIDKLRFADEYRNRVLNTLDPFQVIVDLGMDAILLDSAPLGMFCHRRLVAEWLEESLGINVPECKESTWLWP
jgi:hypothetical protein